MWPQVTTSPVQFNYELIILSRRHLNGVEVSIALSCEAFPLILRPTQYPKLCAGESLRALSVSDVLNIVGVSAHVNCLGYIRPYDEGLIHICRSVKRSIVGHRLAVGVCIHVSFTEASVVV